MWNYNLTTENIESTKSWIIDKVEKKELFLPISITLNFEGKKHALIKIWL
jgi:hypothetical protein